MRSRLINIQTAPFLLRALGSNQWSVSRHLFSYLFIFFKRASILIPSGPTFEIFHFGSKCSECYFNFCFLVTAFHCLWASCSKPLPLVNIKKRKLHQPKHDISQMEWNHLNVAELTGAHCFVVLPSITAPLKQSKTNKQNNNDKKNKEFKLMAWQTLIRFQLPWPYIKDPGYKGLFHSLFMSEMPRVITEMEFVSGSTKPPLAIIV